MSKKIEKTANSFKKEIDSYDLTIEEKEMLVAIKFFLFFVSSG